MAIEFDATGKVIETTDIADATVGPNDIADATIVQNDIAVATVVPNDIAVATVVPPAKADVSSREAEGSSDHTKWVILAGVLLLILLVFMR